MNLLAIITPRALQKQLPFMFIGGHAVIAHGHVRNTFDLDLLIRAKDSVEWSLLADGLGYELFRERPAFLQFIHPKEELVPLDLMRVDDATFEKMSTESRDFLPVIGARYVSLKHLIALKCHAIKHGGSERSLRDMDDLVHLVTIHGVDVNEPEWRDLILKHGTNELYETLQRVARLNG